MLPSLKIVDEAGRLLTDWRNFCLVDGPVSHERSACWMVGARGRSTDRPETVTRRTRRDLPTDVEDIARPAAV